MNFRNLIIIICAVLLIALLDFVLDCNPGSIPAVNDYPIRVLLISSDVGDADTLISAAQNEVLVIKYDAEKTTLESLLHQIREALGDRKAGSIGFVVHDSGEARFYLTRSETISLVSIQRNVKHRAFWKGLGKVVSTDGRIDIFACNVTSSEEGKALISSLEDIAGANVAASSNRTGNTFAGGDWVLETDNIDIADCYFDHQRLSRFPELFVSLVKILKVADSEVGDQFGKSVGISGDYAIVGTYVDWDDAAESGKAYIFYRNKGGNDNWGLQKKLRASDAAYNDEYGTAVAISGDYAVVGAHYNDDGAIDSGSAYLYYRNKGGTNKWGEVKKLLPDKPSTQGYFGRSMAMNGDYILIGAEGADTDVNGSGAAYIYYSNQGGQDNWGQQATLSASDATFAQWFGRSVAIDGNYVIVGTNKDKPGGLFSAGSAYIFHRNKGGKDNWGQVVKLVPSDSRTNQYFGSSVAISGDYAVVSSNYPWGNFSDYVYIFYKNKGGSDNWGEVTKLSYPFADDDDSGFGRDIAMSGDNIITTTTKGLSIFVRNHGGNDNWGLVKILEGYWGGPISISGSVFIVGFASDEAAGIFGGVGNGASLTISHKPVKKAKQGKQIAIKAKISHEDGKKIKAFMYYRPAGSKKFKRIKMTISGKFYQAVIPADYVICPGVEYYIKAKAGKEKSYSGSKKSPHLIKVK